MADNPTEQPPVGETPPQPAAAVTPAPTPAPPAAPVADAVEGLENEQAAPESDEAAQIEQDEQGDEQLEDEDLTDEELDELRANEIAYSWEAFEYVHHHKDMRWYLIMAGVLVLLVAISLVMQLWMTALAFVAMGAAIAVYARKPPRTLLYELTPAGITIDGKIYPYKELRSFAVLPDEEWHTIDLEPTKRFMPRISVLFEDDDFEQIVGHLELHLPRVDRKPDVIEQVTRRLRF